MCIAATAFGSLASTLHRAMRSYVVSIWNYTSVTSARAAEKTIDNVTTAVTKASFVIFYCFPLVAQSAAPMLTEPELIKLSIRESRPFCVAALAIHGDAGRMLSGSFRR